MRVETTVHVNAASSEIWSVLSDWSGVWRYQPWVLRSPQLSDQNEGVGAARRCEFVDDTSIVETVTKWDVSRKIELELTETPKPMKGGWASIELNPVGAATNVTLVMDIKLGLGPLNPIMGPLMMRPMMKKRIIKMLESLEYHIKTGGKIDHKGRRHKPVAPMPSMA